MTKLTGGQVLVQSLENRGVKTIFGMPGINILHIHIAKEAHGFSRGRNWRNLFLSIEQYYRYYEADARASVRSVDNN